MPVPGIINLNDATPAAPSGFQNAKWQADSNNPRNVSDCVPSTGGVNIQTTSYTAVAADNGKIISVNAAGATTLTLPAAPPFAQWNIFVENIGAGTLTVSPNGLNLDGSASSITVGTNQGTYISTDGTNYFTGTRGLGLTNPMTTKGDVIVGATSGVPARLGVGTNGEVLTANSSATDGVDWEAPIALTTTGTSGAATLTPGNPYTLNVPQYSGGGGGMTLIASVIPLVNTATITFSSIPGTFNNLRIVYTARGSASVVEDFLFGFFNNDNTGGHYGYAFTKLTTAANTPGGSTSNNNTYFGGMTGASATSAFGGSGVVDIPAYALTTLQKQYVVISSEALSGSGNISMIQIAGRWASSAAITRIDLTCTSNFIPGSAFYLYGY